MVELQLCRGLEGDTNHAKDDFNGSAYCQQP